MGAEQSNSASRHERAANAAVEQQRHVEQILEAQRQLYEKRCRDLLQEQAAKQAAAAARTPSPVRGVRAPAAPRPSTSQTISNPTNLAVPSHMNDQKNFERNRTPYSFTERDLQNSRETAAPTPQTFSLYPNLNNNGAVLNNTAAGNTSQGSFSNNGPATNNTNSPASGFVFVNRNGSERIRPSAPPAPRDRSVSRSRNSNEDREWNCPTCGNIFGLYIYQCPSGHSSCKFCKVRGAPCGLCRQPITDMRNIALESFVAERKMPCVNKEDGCSLIIKLADMDIHARECPFKEFACPMDGLFGRCPWIGKLNQLGVHFNHIHPEHRQAEEDQEMHLPNICTDNKFLFLIVKGTFHFLFHLWVSEKDRMIYMTTQLLGTKFSAQKWTYEVQIYNKREPRRKYQYADVCNSWNEPVNDIYKESRCASLPLSYAMNFVNEGTICYKFSIEKPFKGKMFTNRNLRGRGGKRQ